MARREPSPENIMKMLDEAFDIATNGLGDDEGAHLLAYYIEMARLELMNEAKIVARNAPTLSLPMSLH